MKLNLILINLIIILNNFWLKVQTNTIGVPVLLWTKSSQQLVNKNSNPFESISSQSNVNQISSHVLRDDYLKSETILAFIQNHLSVEQLSAEEKPFKTIKTIISDQSLKPLLLTDVLDPLEALKDFTFQDINHLNINNGNKIVINLPKNSLLENDHLIGQLIANSGQNVTENVLYLITGRHNSYSQIDDNDIEDSHRFLRHILAENLDLNKGKAINTKDSKLEKLITIGKDCLYFFSNSMTVNHYNESLANTSIPIISIDGKPEVLPESKCWKIIEDKFDQQSEAVLHLLYKGSDDYPSLELKLLIDSPFYRNRIDFWRIKKGIAVLTESSTSAKTSYNLTVDKITAENRFSYSCSKLVILSEITTNKKGLTQISIVFNKFQLQPFKNPNKNGKTVNPYIFTESFDCQTWMTLPLWMGLICILFLCLLIAIGVYFLSEIKTMDRFENPKGKSITVATTD